MAPLMFLIFQLRGKNFVGVGVGEGVAVFTFVNFRLNDPWSVESTLFRPN